MSKASLPDEQARRFDLLLVDLADILGELTRLRCELNTGDGETPSAKRPVSQVKGRVIRGGQA